jgi:hypothetical protein
MLDAAYNFEATMALTNGSTVNASARTMLNADHFTYWLEGSVATSVIIADHSNTLTCNAHPCSTYDIGFDTDKSFRPIFHATFWPTINKVKLRYIGEISQTESLQDQTYSLSLAAGNSSPTTVFTHSSFTHAFQTRWTASRNNQSGQTWSVSTGSGSRTIRKEIWIGGAPTPVAIDHNVAWLAKTKFLPNYDTSATKMNAVTTSLIDSDFSPFSSGVPAFNSFTGYATADQANTGGRPEIGPYPDQFVRWLYKGDVRSFETAVMTAEQACAWSTHLREGKTAKKFLRTDAGGSSTGMGKIISLSGRPTLRTKDFSHGDTQTADRITEVGTGSFHGVADIAHAPEVNTPLYLVTGEFFWLEQAWLLVAWHAGWEPAGTGSGYAYERGPTGAEGILSHIQVRGGAWMLARRVEAAGMTPDGLAERTYLDTLVADGLADQEGWYNIQNGTYYQAGANAVWNWGRASATIWGQATVPPMHQAGYRRADMVQTGYGVEGTGVNSTAVSLFEQNFLVYALGRAQDLGYSSAKLVEWFAFFYNNAATDAAYNPWLLCNGRIPLQNTSNVYYNTWAGLKAAYQAVWENATNCFPGPPFDQWVDASPPDGYGAHAAAAITYTYPYTSGSAAWTWASTNIQTGDYGGNPKWAFVPRTAATNPTITTSSLSGGTVGVSYSQTVSAIDGTTPYTWSISSGTLPTGLTINSSSGAITGTPSGSPGTAMFTVLVTDNASATDTQDLSITISAAPSGTGVGISGRVNFSGTVTIR